MIDFQPGTDDMSPALGGARAIPEPPREVPPSQADQGPNGPPGAEAFQAELASLFGAEGAQVLQALSQIGELGQGLNSLTNLFTNTLQALEARLPETLAVVFEGLVDAVGEAMDQALEPNDANRPNEDA
jgi:hypothetical protein